MPLPPLLDVLLQMRNPLYKWQLWKSEVRYQRYCGKRHYEIAMDKLKRLREHPPEPHTIAGTTVVQCVSLMWGTPPRLGDDLERLCLKTGCIAPWKNAALSGVQSNAFNEESIHL
jgi:hypothetical protein